MSQGDFAPDLRCGDWRTALADVEMVDALITDCPYGARTHEGHDDGVEQANALQGTERRALAYSSWSESDVADFVDSWAPRVRGWMCSITSHDLVPAWSDSMERHGRYPFAPLPIIQKRPRLVGDGPASWAVYMAVSRPKTVEFSRWGCLPGAYEAPTARLEGVVGSKPMGLMRAIIRDYTRPGELVADPCCGGATTLIAARDEGRRSVGAELDPKTFALAQARIARGYTPQLFGDA